MASRATWFASRSALPGAITQTVFTRYARIAHVFNVDRPLAAAAGESGKIAVKIDGEAVGGAEG